MCKAFSAIVLKNGDVKWKFGMDSHGDILSHFKISDNESEKERLKFARIEISPANNNYLKPDKWEFKLDEKITPTWWKKSYQIFAETEHKKWLKQLHKILINKEIIMPFNVKPPTKILKKHLILLNQWASVGARVGARVHASVGDSVHTSVYASVGARVGAGVYDSVYASVYDSVYVSVGASVYDGVYASVYDSVHTSVYASVYAYTGSFFKLKRNQWKYTDKIKTKDYPFQPLVDLWEMGLVPSFDGTIWHLHGGKNAKILWEGELK